MKRQFVLFKIYLNEVLYKRFDTLEELKKGYSSSEDFKGEATAEYDLDADKYLYIKDFPGDTSILQPTLEVIRGQYNKEVLS